MRFFSPDKHTVRYSVILIDFPFSHYASKVKLPGYLVRLRFFSFIPKEKNNKTNCCYLLQITHTEHAKEPHGVHKFS